MNKDRFDLEGIRECLERIEEYAGADEAKFMNSHLIQDGVIRNLELIGEATKNLSAELRARQSRDSLATNRWDARCVDP